MNLSEYCWRGSCHVSCNYTYQNFWNENKYEITMDSQFLYYRYEEKQSNGTRNMKNVSFVPKGVQGIYHHIKFWKSIMSRLCFFLCWIQKYPFHPTLWKRNFFLKNTKIPEKANSQIQNLSLGLRSGNVLFLGK